MCLKCLWSKVSAIYNHLADSQFPALFLKVKKVKWKKSVNWRLQPGWLFRSAPQKSTSALCGRHNCHMPTCTRLFGRRSQPPRPFIFVPLWKTKPNKTEFKESEIVKSQCLISADPVFVFLHMYIHIEHRCLSRPPEFCGYCTRIM